MIFQNFKKKLYKAYSKKVPATGIGVFRIIFGTILLIAALQNMYFIRLFSDDLPFNFTGEIDLRYGYVLWIVVIVCLITGLKTKYAAIANYILIVTLIGSLSSFTYPLDYIATTISLLIIFVPTGNSLSLDNLIEKLKYSTPGNDYHPPQTTRQLNYFILVFFGIGMIYLFSVPGKLFSPMWMRGLGVWIPASIPQHTSINLSPILNQEYLIKFLGYLSLAYEMSFAFLFYRKNFRLPLLIIGCGLHFGIFMALAIPAFALLPISVLVLLLPFSCWKQISSLFTKPSWFSAIVSAPTKKLTVFYDEKCVLCNKWRIIISHFDLFSRINFTGIGTAVAENPEIKEIGPDKLFATCYSIDSSGRLFKGLESYQQIFLHLYLLFPIGILMYIPGIKTLLRIIYRQVLPANPSHKYVKSKHKSSFSARPDDHDNTPLFGKLRWKIVKFRLICFAMIFILLNQTFMFLKDDYVIEEMAKRSNIDPKTVNLNYYETLYDYGFYVNKLMGLSPYGLFLFEFHFKDYDHLVAITFTTISGREVWLPLYRESGMVDFYNVDRFWGRWNFKSNNPDINQKRLSAAIRMYSAFWAEKYGVPLTKAKFNVKVKVYDEITGWEKDYLNKQLAKEWKDGGYVEFQNYEFFDDNLKDIEAIK